MNLNTVTSVLRPASTDELAGWPPGHAWLAGGTWLFSEPQPTVDTLVDLDTFAWPDLHADESGLTIAATCRIAAIYHFVGPQHWHALPLLRECCNAFLASFKIWNTATVGGNICMSLPAGPMISLCAALEGVCTLWPRDAQPREVAVRDFVTGNHMNVLAPGELLRSIHLPASALQKRVAMRHTSLTKLGRSAALLIGSSNASGDLTLTITAATDRPLQLHFATMPNARTLREAIDTQIADARWFDDVHGSAPYKRHVAHYFAEEIRNELAAGATS
jgi:CO/xanthine dehydrogenase FAD-binding subunit